MSILASNISFLSDRYVIKDIQYNEYLPQTITYDLTKAFNTSTTISDFLNAVPAANYMYTGITDCRITFVYSYGGIAEFYICKCPDNLEESWKSPYKFSWKTSVPIVPREVKAYMDGYMPVLSLSGFTLKIEENNEHSNF